MKSQRLIARLGGKSAQLEQAGHSFDALSEQDISAALAGSIATQSERREKLPEGAYLVGMAKWAQSAKCRNQLYPIVFSKSSLIARIHGWESKELYDMLEKISRLVIDEVIDNAVCQICEGHKALETELTYILKDNQAVICPACEGSGTAVMTGKDRAKRLDMDTDQWYIWSKRYEQIYRIVSGWDAQVLHHLSERLKEDE